MAGYSVAGAGAVSFVDVKLKQRKVALFTKSFSPECKKIKAILDNYKLSGNDYEVCEIQSRQDCTQIENYFHILCLSDTRTVPQLFIERKYIGSEPEIERMHESGDLTRLLIRAGVYKPEKQQ